MGDFLLAARRLRATPLFTTFAILSLAVGIAVTTAVYSIVESIFFRDIGVRDPHTIAFVVTPFQGRVLQGTISEPDFRDLRDAQRSLGAVSASAALFAVVSSATTERLAGEAVDGAYFATLGVPAAMGRVIDPRDDALASRVVVLSDRLWRSRFGADPAIVGTTIRLAEQSFEVIGVTPPAFGGVRGGFMLVGANFWVPLAAEALFNPARRSASPREDRRLLVFGRLAPGVTVPRASADLAAIAASLDRVYPPRRQAPGWTERPWQAKSAAALSAEDNPVRRFGITIVLLVALVLAVACTNLANLVLARGTARERDLAVRRALGASRGRLVREQFAESLIVAVAGGIAAYGTFHLLAALIGVDFNLTLLGGQRWTLEIRPSLNMTATLIAVGSLLISLVIFGLEPALQLTRALDIRRALGATTVAGTPRARRQRLLIRWQVAIAAGFFVVATMFVKFAITEARHDPGIEMERLAVALVDLRTSGWDRRRLESTVDRLLAEARNHPSLEAVAVSTGLPFGVPNSRLSLSRVDSAVVDGLERRPASGIGATPSIFRSLGVPIVRGRGFDDRDHAASPPVVVLSEYTARLVFGTVDVVGRQVAVHRDGSSSRPVTIIGVAGDTDVGRIFGNPQPFVYMPLSQHFDAALTVVARASDAATAVQGLRQTLLRTDRELGADVIDTARSILAGPYQIVRAAGVGSSGLGALTLLLAMFGLFGIQSHIIGYRTREIGVRMSVGATSRVIKTMVLKDGFRPVFDGLVLGVFGGFAGRVVVRAYLEIEVTIFDPWLLLITPIPVILAGFCACYLPAHRAARVDPNVALRYE